MLNHIKEKIKHFFEWNNSHDLDHTMRVHDMCIYIWNKEWANIEILQISALMHDIGRKKQHETKGKVCHAEYGTKLADEILSELGIEENKKNQILHCISTHRFRKWNEPQSLEAKILFDADKLDSIWAVWIGRAFMYANEVWARLHNNVGTKIEETEEHWPEDTAYREFEIKLKKVKDRLFTESAKKIAEKKHKIMVDFFENLNDEVWNIKK